MELRQLEILSAIVETGSLTAAATRCNLSQPAISQQVQALEQELGEALLIRKHRGVEPTAAGLTLLEHATRLLGERDRLLESFSERRNLQRGQIAFGIIPTIAPYLLPRWLGPFRERFPGIGISISESRTADLVTMLQEGKIEFAILSDVSKPLRERSGLELRELFKEPLLLACPPRHPLAIRKAAPQPSELQPTELIHLKGGHCLGDQTLRLCHIREPDPGLQCDQLATAVGMVAAGLGVTIVPKLAMDSLPTHSVVIREFAGKSPQRVITLLWKKGTKFSPAAEALLGERVLANPS